jgi:hypothetical protein
VGAYRRYWRKECFIPSPEGLPLRNPEGLKVPAFRLCNTKAAPRRSDGGARNRRLQRKWPSIRQLPVRINLRLASSRSFRLRNVLYAHALSLQRLLRELFFESRGWRAERFLAGNAFRNWKVRLLYLKLALMGSCRTGKWSKKRGPSRESPELRESGRYTCKILRGTEKQTRQGADSYQALDQEVRTLASHHRQKMVRNTHSEEGDWDLPHRTEAVHCSDCYLRKKW